MEIFRNEFVGAVDLNVGLCGVYGGVEYEYAAWIHGNRFTPDPTPKEAHGGAKYEETAVILEWRTERTLIEDNSITGYNQALYFNLREGVFDFTFRRNRCVGLGGNAGSMFRVDGIGEGLRVENFTVADNVFEGDPSALSGFGIIISQEMAPWTGRNIAVCGNTVANTLFGWLVIDDYTFIDGLTVRDNTWSNAGGEYLLRSADDVGGYVFSGNEGTGERP